jgi:hypothetical protein
MKRLVCFALLAVLISFSLLASNAFAYCDNGFSIYKSKSGKIIMKNFDKNIDSYVSDGVYQETGKGVTKNKLLCLP